MRIYSFTDYSLPGGGLSARKGSLNSVVLVSYYPPNLRALGGIYIFMGSSQGGYPPVREGKKNALFDVVDIMGFNFGHVTPILRKTEKRQKKPITKVGRLSFLTPQIAMYPS